MCGRAGCAGSGRGLRNRWRRPASRRHARLRHWDTRGSGNGWRRLQLRKQPFDAQHCRTAWRRDTDHIEKAFVFAGMPARNGVTAALPVKSGWNGVDDIFAGPDNFFAAYAPKAQPDRVIEKLGERYEITQTDIKKWSVGSPIQGPLDAIEVIRSKRPFEADQVKKVTVRLAPSVATVVDNRDIPDICLQHLVAVMLIDKTVSFHAAHDKPRMQDAAVQK